jgi:hypothetical protein
VFSCLDTSHRLVTLRSDRETENQHVQRGQGGEVFRRQNRDARIWNLPSAVGIKMQGRMQNSPDKSLGRLKARFLHVGNSMRVPSHLHGRGLIDVLDESIGN